MKRRTGRVRAQMITTFKQAQEIDDLANQVATLQSPDKHKYIKTTGYTNRAMLRSPAEKVKRLYLFCSTCKLPFLSFRFSNPGMHSSPVCQCKVIKHLKSK